MTILDDIVAHKRQELHDGKYVTSTPVGNLVVHSFYDALQKPHREIGIIAEVKKASPSKGILVENFNHVEIAKTYDKLAVDCISVLTDEAFFQGHPSFLMDIKRVTKKPILRKDFIISERQIIDSKNIGADAILLIANILEKNQIKEYMQLAEELQLDVLMEVHNEGELEKVMSVVIPKIVGVNNRDLNTFNTSLETSARLATLIPKDSLFISESGIKRKEDVDVLRNLKVNGMLVGEAFMVQENKQAILSQWFQEDAANDYTT